MANQDFELEIAAKGNVGDEVRSYAEQKVRKAAKLSPKPVLFGRVSLSLHENPSVERPAAAKASLDLPGRRVRAHVAAPTMREAVDRLETRLQRQFEILSERREARRHDTGMVAPGEWRHGAVTAHRPSWFPRPEEEREILRSKTFEVGEQTVKDAILDMELLDHDFHLFTNADTGRDAVVYRTDDGTVQLLESAPEESVTQAIERLEATGERFVFFRDAETGRGNVLYHRYDGHYGLIIPATEGELGPS